MKTNPTTLNPYVLPNKQYEAPNNYSNLNNQDNIGNEDVKNLNILPNRIIMKKIF
jgi:hypothetical protein